jgi:hypothetical protein
MQYMYRDGKLSPFNYHEAMKVYETVEVETHIFLTSEQVKVSGQLHARGSGTTVLGTRNKRGSRGF